MSVTENKIKLGYTVKDAVTGFTGVAVMSAESLTGTKQYFVQPRCTTEDAATIPVDVSIDWQRLDVVDTGVSNRFPEIVDDTGFTLGEKVVTLTSGFQGILMIKYISLNGCIRFLIQSQIHPSQSSNDDYLARELIVDYKDMKRVSAGVTPAVKSEATGGPALKRPHAMSRPR